MEGTKDQVMNSKEKLAVAVFSFQVFALSASHLFGFNIVIPSLQKSSRGAKSL